MSLVRLPVAPLENKAVGVNLTAFEYPERATTQSEQKTTQKTIQNLTGQQQAILSFIKEHPEATRKEISESLSNITEDGVKYNLSRLQELSLLKRIGGRKQGYWQIIE